MITFTNITKPTITDDLVKDVTDFFNYHRKLTKAPKKYYQTLEQSKTTIEEWIDEGEFCIIKREEETVGFINYIYINETFVRLEDIYIKEAYRGQGIGKQAINALDNILSKQGVLACSVNVIPRNKSALAFYINNGFDHLNMIEIRKNYDKSLDKQDEINILGHTLKKY